MQQLPKKTVHSFDTNCIKYFYLLWFDHQYMLSIMPDDLNNQNEKLDCYLNGE